MSFQDMPGVSSSTEFSHKEAKNLLLASIAFEEFGMARLITAEAEKIEHVLGTHKQQGPPCPPATVDQILAVNQAADQVLRDIIKKELLLLMKLESVLASQKPPKQKPHPHPSEDKGPDRECCCR